VVSLVLNYARVQDVHKLEARLDRLEMEANSLQRLLMNGSTRQRMRKVEKLLSETKKEREERQRNWTDYAFQARCHATAVAVVVLSGEPKIGESLGKAWMRTLQHYRIHPHGGKGPRIESQVRAAEKLLPVIIGTRKGDSGISRIVFGTLRVG